MRWRTWQSWWWVVGQGICFVRSASPVSWSACKWLTDHSLFCLICQSNVMISMQVTDWPQFVLFDLPVHCHDQHASDWLTTVCFVWSASPVSWSACKWLTDHNLFCLICQSNVMISMQVTDWPLAFLLQITFAQNWQMTCAVYHC